VLAATNKDLQKEVAAGRFREDLYYRLKVVSVHLDPLAKRREDILPLADHFRKLAAKKNNKQVKGFTVELRKWLLDYSWKGNVRQLRNVVESLVVMDLDGVLGLDDLSPELLEESPPPEGFTLPATTRSISAGGSTDEVADQAGSDSEPAVRLPGGSSIPADLRGKTMAEIERWAIEQTLALTNGNREATAKILDISERNLYRKLKEYQLRR
jgi:two-component system response regulator HydG